MTDSHSERGAVILCGGRSSRMGRDKASLPFHGESMLARTVGIISPSVRHANIVCVAAADQELAGLPEHVQVTRDRDPQLGPLAALGWGLAALPAGCETAVVLGCDQPLLQPRLIELLFGSLGEGRCVAAEVNGRFQPLPMVCRMSLAKSVDQLLAQGKTSLTRLLVEAPCTWLAEPAVRAVDPNLQSFSSCNTPAAYQRAITAAAAKDLPLG